MKRSIVLILASILILSTFPSLSSHLQGRLSAATVSDTVEDVDEQSTELIEEEELDDSGYSLVEELAQNPLLPPNTTSPRATLIDFTNSMNLAYSVLMEAHKENMESPGLFTSELVDTSVQLAEELINRGMDHFDLSGIPEDYRDKIGQEYALMLKEILDRIEVPPFDEIPDIKAIEEEEEKEDVLELDRWRIPNTSIVIAKVKGGIHKDEFLFAPQTVNNLEMFYSKVSNLPYRDDKEVTPHFYDFFVNTPGSLLPPKWSKWVPAWSQQVILGQTIWQWIAMIMLPILALWFVWRFVRIWISKSAELSPPIKITGWIIVVFTIVAIVMAINYTLDTQINISGDHLVFVETTLLKFFVTFLLVITIWEMLKSNIKTKAIEHETEELDGDDDWGARSLSRADTLLVVIRKFLMIVVLTIAFFLLASAMGVNIGPLLAGAGVIGIALGFGSQKLIADVLSGIFFLADDAFRVGEYIEAAGVSGTVEAITLRNVMLRHHRGMLQIVPYSELVSITNYMRGGLIVKFNIELPYDTDIEKVRKIIKKVGREMLDDPEMGQDILKPVKSQGVRSVGDSVMVIRIKFTAKPGKHFLVRREAYRRITEALAAKGINYAHRKVIVEMPEAQSDDVPEEGGSTTTDKGLAGAAAGLENIVRKDKQTLPQQKEEEF